VKVLKTKEDDNNDSNNGCEDCEEYATYETTVASSPCLKRCPYTCVMSCENIATSRVSRWSMSLMAVVDENAARCSAYAA
jgi:hypothetical protein